MPYGRYPERVKDFRKWSTDRVDKAKINDSATGSGAAKGKARSGRAKYRSLNRKRRKAKKEQ